MWGIRAIRAGVLLSGLLAGVGCKTADPVPWGVGDFQSGPPGEKAQPEATPSEPTLGAWTRNPADRGFKEQTTPLTPERIHGGIY
jgi:hypothetical protein